jgi:hypothetical protein
MLIGDEVVMGDVGVRRDGAPGSELVLMSETASMIDVPVVDIAVGERWTNVYNVDDGANDLKLPCKLRNNLQFS